MRTAAALALAAGVALGQDVPDEPLELTNLGFHMELGGLYNAGFNRPVPAYLCEDNFIKARTKTLDTPFLSQKYVTDDKKSSKMDLLSVSGDIAVSLSSITFKGSASYLNDERTTQNEMRMSFATTVHTQTETVDVFHTDIQSAMNRNAMKVATHVVTGIVWGQRKIATFKRRVSGEQELMDVSGYFELALKGASFSIDLSGSVNMTKEDVSDSRYLSIEIFADEVPETIPTELDETMEYLKRVTVDKSGWENGEGRGVPLC